MTVNASEVIEDEDVEDEQADEQVADVAQMEAMPHGSLVRYHQQRYYKDGEQWGTVYESGERARATINSGTFGTAIARGHVFVVDDHDEQVRILRQQVEALKQEVVDAKAEWGEAQTKLAEANEEVETKDRRFDSLIEALHEKAIEKEYCGDFDEVMAELGLPARPREYDVRWEVTYYITTTVRSTDEDEAHNQVDRDDIIEQVRANVSYPSAVNHEYTELS